ncbi:2-amino-4-hydroxy-6-hydroxymethyldihydropteridine diphosphokinase [Rhodococcus chondri]|uniref:2-amino-4-hydroxy-6-hydroxymethyldihydropteridine diphosphokinase n=1 Tax=Rhodococcus chondri TaxID=3065941 RepID=A0ABU7JMV8_9NOCA|nr:2-amino-4-hydroxy-6-hydroxymethyldihydropteridine diphosphokinase [Rhodococcus sp. CC-R104]MEE2031384.1 2-amino-4-hydroxy-6-hydroxymethyldihydropteridine diphosphokinase [Rhodococcus sp. CC-R104]
MSRAVLSIGSNIGDRFAHLQSVVDTLGPRVVAVSAVYSTAPWGGVEQQDFLNAVVVAEDSTRSAHDWLLLGRELEAAADRVRVQRWGPRSLDVDILTCCDAAGEVRSDDPELTLPHPRAHQRAFVLVPWLDVEGDGELTVGGVRRRLADLLAELDPAERGGVRRCDLSLSAPTLSAPTPPDASGRRREC